MDEASRIADLDDLATDDTFLFRVRRSDGNGDGGSSPGDDGDEREAILLRLADDDGEPSGDVVAWLNYCQHFTHIKLDKGSGAPVRDDEVVCANHGAMFEADSGLCTFGPCEGAVLNEVEVATADGGVYLADDDYAFVGVGPGEDDGDMSSSSNVIL